MDIVSQSCCMFVSTQSSNWDVFSLCLAIMGFSDSASSLVICLVFLTLV